MDEFSSLEFDIFNPENSGATIAAVALGGLAADGAQNGGWCGGARNSRGAMVEGGHDKNGGVVAG